MPRPVLHLRASRVTAAEPDAKCTVAQLRACAIAQGGLASLEGLDDFLVDALESGVAKPAPARSGGFGWSPLEEAMLKPRAEDEDFGRRLTETSGLLEVGGGSGAGLQIICDGKGIASLGGGGGGGAAGKFRGDSAGMQRPGKNASIGGGGGGGMQLFFPALLDDKPWTADKWLSWSSGGGSGCGTCKLGDVACASSAHGVKCGAKMDDVGAVDEAKGRRVANYWRVGVLRRCYEDGRLAVIGGGGGGSGGAECCKAVPTLNFGFGFRAEFKPPAEGAAPLEMPPWDEQHSEACCPDLAHWNVTSAGQSNSGSGTFDIARRLTAADMEDSVFLNAVSNVVRRLTAADVRDGPTVSGKIEVTDPFAMENTGHAMLGGANRRPNLSEMVGQHAQRLGVDASTVVNRIEGPSCVAPSWLNGTNLTELYGHNATENRTREPEEAMKYIMKFNPLQGYLAEGASQCPGGWGDWCCLCHTAAWRIACLPSIQRSAVDWFITEDCCESQLLKNASQPGSVVDATPKRSQTVAWRPELHAFAELPDHTNDSFDWEPQTPGVVSTEVAPLHNCPIIPVVLAVGEFAVVEARALTDADIAMPTSRLPAVAFARADSPALRLGTPLVTAAAATAIVVSIVGACVARLRRLDVQGGKQPAVLGAAVWRNGGPDVPAAAEGGRGASDGYMELLEVSPLNG